MRCHMSEELRSHAEETGACVQWMSSPGDYMIMQHVRPTSRAVVYIFEHLERRCLRMTDLRRGG